MATLVLGASGFVGSHLVCRLLEEGEEVVALLLPGEDPEEYRRRLGELTPGPVDPEVIPGDLGEAGVLEPLLERCSRVHYLVGCMRGLRQERYQEINVELLRKVVRSPSWTPDHRFVLLSSVSALGPSLASNPLNESAAPTPVGFYGTSKLAGERVLQEEDFPARWLILRPPSLYGPGDPCFLDVFRLAGRGLYPALGARSLQFQLVFVADLVEAMRAVTQVLDSASSLPPILHLGNPQVLTHEDWRREFQGVHGHAVRALYLGTWGTRLLGWMGAGKELVTGTPELTGPDKATHLLAGDWVHDLSGFDAVMGERAWTSLETGTRLTHRWYEDHGWYAR